MHFHSILTLIHTAIRQFPFISNEQFSFLIGVIGNVTAVLVLLSPVGTFWRIVKRRSTEEFQIFPYIFGLVCASLWTYYGIIKPGGLLVATINEVGVSIMTTYVVLFLVFAPPKVRVKAGILVGIFDIGFLVAAILVGELGVNGKTRLDTVGILCAGLTISVYCSPLAAMKRAVEMNSVEFMPLWLSVSMVVNGGLWALYGFLVNDKFILVSNATGYFLGTIQVLFYVVYRDGSNSSNSSRDGLEEGWLHENLV
ncbi:hypothetical protein LIER_06941 [Lithospermum erythrorhizon]|uniref:Bidirectional sugar transporter SWEET n=1 Tax=Lithospermum erythrorhizon TaxID=34254 RepID=A0AAV3P868_LITER